MSTMITSLLQSVRTAESRLAQIAPHFESLLEDAMGKSSGQAPASAPAATSGPAATSANTAAPSNDLSPQDTQNLLNGDYFSSKPQDSKATCPSSVSMDQLMTASGGLLSKMGNQTLKGKGAQDITGGIKDNLARLAGGKPGDIGKDKNVTMRALMIAQSWKNVPDTQGKMLPASIRHNGNLSGLNPSGEVDDSSELGYAQNMFKDSNYALPDHRTGNAHLNGNDTEKSGAHVWWNEWGEKAVIGLAAAPVLAVPGAGEALEGGVVAGEVGAEVGAGAAEAGAGAAEAGEGAAGAAGAAGRAAGTAGRTAGNAGSSAGSSAASNTMKQLALQTAKESAKQTGKEVLKEGGKEAWNQIQNQLQPAGSPSGTPYPPMISA